MIMEAPIEVKAIYKGDESLLHYCPNCGESYYREDTRMRTAVYYPPIYKNGVNVNPDRNKTTVYCTCMNCKHEFHYEE